MQNPGVIGPLQIFPAGRPPAAKKILLLRQNGTEGFFKENRMRPWDAFFSRLIF
jgi:hypothetical protein